jgi:Holliday junction DNA helicase RuvA
MIGLLRGTLAHGAESEVVVDVGGVGYRVTVTPATRVALGAEPGEFLLWIHTQLRQDALVLFGFPSQVEREVFELLLTTPGVGPSLAMAILGTLGASGVVSAVAAEDVTAFERVSGVGKKTAARLALELQGKFADVEVGEGLALLAALPGSDELAEVADALVALGYSSEEVRRALGVLDGDEAVEVALRLALRELSRR